ncbi:unnamed protein product [Boreogadus saida]
MSAVRTFTEGLCHHNKQDCVSGSSLRRARVTVPESLRACKEQSVSKDNSSMGRQVSRGHGACSLLLSHRTGPSPLLVRVPGACPALTTGGIMRACGHVTSLGAQGLRRHPPSETNTQRLDSNQGMMSRT